MEDPDRQQEQDIDAKLRADSLRLLARMDALLEHARSIIERKLERRPRVAVLKDEPPERQ